MNDAFQTLKNPQRRGLHLLALSDFKIPENHTINDAALLEENMEWRERLMEEDTAAIRKELAILLEEAYAQFAQLYSENQLEQAYKTLVRARYFEKL